MAVDCIYGKYGNGEERKQNLGNYYEETQNIINDMYEIIMKFQKTCKAIISII